MPAGFRLLTRLLPAAAIAAIALPVGSAVAATSGGLEAGAAPSTKAAGGTTPSTRTAGGANVSARTLGGSPVARAFRVAPARVTAGGVLPRIRVRFEERGVARLKARMVVVPVGGKGTVVRLDLGTVQTGRTLSPAWPSGTHLAAGRYVARVHAVDPVGRQLRRTRSASGRMRLTVLAAPTAPAPAPAPPAAPLSPVIPSGAAGTFPVAGPHTFGQGFGVDRGTHVHQGVDILAAQGTPNVAPTAGTIRFTSYQASAAGEYVVMHSVAGPDYFFAHCVRGSTVVSAGQAVHEGQPLCAVGRTGDADATHLHFELWPNGWRTGAKDSVPVDPLPQLRAWDR